MTTPEAILEILYKDYLKTLHNDWIVLITCKYSFETVYHTYKEYAYIDEDNNVCWLNDWFEGQDDYKRIEYIAVDDINNFTHKIMITKEVLK